MPLHRNDSRPSIDTLKRVLAYVPETGQFFYRVARGLKRAGDEAGRRQPRGYVIIPFKGQNLSAHRLAVAFTSGSWPDGVVDHINGNPSDNRICNLRVVTQSLNVAASYVRRKRGKRIGVHFKRNGWEAEIKYHRQNYYLGRFKTEEDAQAAYYAKMAELRGAAVFIGRSPMAPAANIDGGQFITAKQPKPNLTLELLRQEVSYDPCTGIFVRLNSKRYKGRESGQHIGVQDRHGYFRAKILGKAYLLHRLAWFYMTGEWPVGEVHHKNHNPADTRWENLADVTKLENNRLRRRSGPIPRARLQVDVQ